jgi:hypothetical protein
VLVTRMLTQDVTTMGTEEGAPSGTLPRTRFQMTCWRSMAKTPYNPPTRTSVTRGFGARGHHDAHPDRRDQYGNQGGRPGIPSQGMVKAGDAQERPHEA